MSQPDSISWLLGAGTTLAGVVLSQSTLLWRERVLHRRTVNQQKADRLRAEYKTLLANAHAWGQSMRGSVQALQDAASEKQHSQALKLAEEDLDRTGTDLLSSIQTIDIEPDVPRAILGSYFSLVESLKPANQAIHAALREYRELIQNWQSLLQEQRLVLEAAGLAESANLDDWVGIAKDCLALPMSQGTRAKLADWLTDETGRNLTQLTEIVEEMLQLPSESKSSLENELEKIDRWISELRQAIRSRLAALEK